MAAVAHPCLIRDSVRRLTDLCPSRRPRVSCTSALLGTICYSFSSAVSQAERSLYHPNHIRWKQPQHLSHQDFWKSFGIFAFFPLQSLRGWRRGMAKSGKRDLEITLEGDSDRHGDGRTTKNYSLGKDKCHFEGVRPRKLACFKNLITCSTTTSFPR